MKIHFKTYVAMYLVIVYIYSTYVHVYACTYVAVILPTDDKMRKNLRGTLTMYYVHNM